MKKMILVLAMVLMLVVAGAAIADEVTLNGEVFTVTQYGQLFLLTFERGPFGGGESGIVTISTEGYPAVPIGYVFDNPYCTFNQEVRYALIGDELVFAPEGALTFTRQAATE